MKKKIQSLAEFAKLFGDEDLNEAQKLIAGDFTPREFRRAPIVSVKMRVPSSVDSIPISLSIPEKDPAPDYSRPMYAPLFVRMEDRALARSEERLHDHMMGCHMAQRELPHMDSRGLLTVDGMDGIVRKVKYKPGSAVSVRQFGADSFALLVSIRVHERDTGESTEVGNQSRIEEEHRSSEERFLFFIMERFHSVELHELREQFRYLGGIFDDPHSATLEGDGDTPEGWLRKIKHLGQKLRYLRDERRARGENV